MCCEAWASVSTAPNHCLHPVPPSPAGSCRLNPRGASRHYHNPPGGCAETQIAAQRTQRDSFSPQAPPHGRSVPTAH